MASLFRRPPDDLGPLRDAVASLGTTSVPGLAAALSWRERRTEKALVEELSRPGTPLTYDPALRVVRWAPPIAEEPPPTAELEPAAPPDADEPPAPGPRSILAPSGARLACPSCHVPLLPASIGSIVVCPNCGRLTTMRARAPGTDAEAAPEPSSTPARGSSPIADRRSQELFAAYVTSKPIPCPRCRTPLRHKGISEYACPACGETVRFASASPPASASRAAPASTPEPRATEPRSESTSAPPSAENERPPTASASVPVKPVSPTEDPGAGPRPPSGTLPVDPPPVDPSPASLPSRVRADTSHAYLPPPAPSGPSRSPPVKKSRLPRIRATCRVPPRFVP